MENTVMGMILDEGLEAEKAAAKWLKKHPQILEKWLKGVTTIDGKNGIASVKKYLKLK